MITTADRQACLQGCTLFSGLEVGTLKVLAEAFDTESFAEGEDVCLHGEEADCVYVVLRGELGIYLPGHDQPIRRVGSGAILGEYGMFSGTRTASLRAEKETTLLSMDYGRFRSFLFQYPNAMYGLLEVAVQRLSEAEARLRG